MKYEIEKDPYLNCYVIWEVHNNYKIDRYRAKLKRDCKKYLEEVLISD